VDVLAGGLEDGAVFAKAVENWVGWPATTKWSGVFIPNIRAQQESARWSGVFSTIQTAGMVPMIGDLEQSNSKA
jgi:hypothetical protein